MGYRTNVSRNTYDRRRVDSGFYLKVCPFMEPGKGAGWGTGWPASLSFLSD